MSVVKTIKAPILHEMEEFEIKFRDSMKSTVPLLDKITHYIIKRKGKQMRPMFVFLTAKLFADPVPESSYRAASLIELLHTATLVHDDVVDDAMERRGFFSINALWKNKVAVLVGDYLLGMGLKLSVDHSELKLLQIVSRAVQEMSEGELRQMEKARKLDIKEAVYFKIIRQKTASLIGACCAAGASSTGADDALVEKLWEFGIKVGIAFQIKDDLFDFGFGEKIGKPTGIDIKEKKMTLPLIHALNNCSYRERKRIINLVRNHNEDPARVNEVINFVLESNGIPYAQAKMMEYRDQAIEVLRQFPEGPSRDSLELLVNYTVDRKK